MSVNENSIISADNTRLATSSRRQFLVGSAGTVAGLGILSLAPSAYAESGHAIFQKEFMAWKQADALIAHSDFTAETRRDAIGQGVVTPSDRLFVRNNLPAPSQSIVADPDRWEVSISDTAHYLPVLLQCRCQSHGQCAGGASGNGRHLLHQRRCCRRRLF